MDEIINIERKTTYDIYLNYSSKDHEFAAMIEQELRNNGLTVFGVNAIVGSESFAQSLAEGIKASRALLPVITENYIESAWCIRELEYAVSLASDRAKLILPVFTDANALSGSKILQFLLSPYHCTYVNKTQEDAKRIAALFAPMFLDNKQKNAFYTKLSEYIQAGAKARASELICDYLPEFCERIENTSFEEGKKLLSELFLLLEKLNNLYDFDYSDSSRALAHKKNDAAGVFYKLLKLPFFDSHDIFYIASALRIIYYYREIRYDAIDAMTSGDLSYGIINAVPIAEYIECQRPYLERFKRECEEQYIFCNDASRYSAEELEFITDTERFIYTDRTPDHATPIIASKHTQEQQKTKEEDILCSIASFMREGNKLFDLIGNDSNASEFIRCLILSYERLKAYCEVIGEKEICAECIDRIHELKDRLEKEDSANSVSETVNNGIKTLLGLTQPKSGKFDLFICHKSDDADIAEDLYYFMKRNMKEAFFDKESLPEMSESQYRKAIMQALDGSKHFVVVFSNLDYLESYWVNLEMEIFQSEIDEGRKKGSNFLMIVTNSVYEQIMSSNKSVLPIDFRRCEIMRVDEYQSKLLNYIK